MEELCDVRLRALHFPAIHVAHDWDEDLVCAFLVPADGRHEEAAQFIQVWDTPLERVGVAIDFWVEVGLIDTEIGEGLGKENTFLRGVAEFAAERGGELAFEVLWAG